MPARVGRVRRDQRCPVDSHPAPSTIARSSKTFAEPVAFRTKNIATAFYMVVQSTGAGDRARSSRGDDSFFVFANARHSASTGQLIGTAKDESVCTFHACLSGYRIFANCWRGFFGVCASRQGPEYCGLDCVASSRAFQGTNLSNLVDRTDRSSY